MARECCGSNCKDPENRSKKSCVCGGHNKKNRKKNLKHNATKTKNNIRQARKVKKTYSEDYFDDIGNSDFSE
jgi:hypothetical protein